jgi:hypothetical protein
MTAQEKKQIDKYKKKVFTKYPKAFLTTIGNRYTIAQEMDDLSVQDILADLFFQPTTNPIKAWELAQLSVKTDQNLNRTHPLRIEGMLMADKIVRVAERKLRAETAMESRKKKGSDIY